MPRVHRQPHPGPQRPRWRDPGLLRLRRRTRGPRHEPGARRSRARSGRRLGRVGLPSPEILDTTLREGEQTPGVYFRLEDKLKIARKLDEFGVDYIEAGHPRVSEEIRQGVQQIAKLGLDANIVAHSRAIEADVDVARQCDADWVGIFFSVRDKRLEAQFRKYIAQHVDPE